MANPYIQGTDVRLNLMARPRIASKPGRGNLGANVRTFCFGVNPAPSVWGSHAPKMGAKRFTTIFWRQKSEFRSAAAHKTFRHAPRRVVREKRQTFVAYIPPPLPSLREYVFSRVYVQFGPSRILIFGHGPNILMAAKAFCDIRRRI